MAPYRTHRATDYSGKKYSSCLSRERIVIKKIEELLKREEPNLRLSKIKIAESRVKFAAGFDLLCSCLSPTLTVEELDARHNGDAIYVSVYDRILRQKKKRKLAQINEDVAIDDVETDEDE